MIRWLCVCAGIVCLARGIAYYFVLHRPRPMELEEASHLDQPEFVIVRGHLDLSRARYQEFPDQAALTRFCPLDGRPLLGPQGVPEREWDRWLGSEVSVDSPVDIAKADTRSWSVRSHPTFEPAWVSFHLAPLSAAQNVWIVGGPVVAVEKEKFADKKSFSGRLYRVSKDKLEGLVRIDLDRIAHAITVSSLNLPVGSWLIIPGNFRESSTYIGRDRSAYAPLAEGGDSVWLQQPLHHHMIMSDSFRGADGKFQGVWHPRGTHSFAPDALGPDPAKAALVDTFQEDIDQFLHDRWLGHWSFKILIAGIVLVCLGIILRWLRPTARPDIPVTSAHPSADTRHEGER